MARIVNENNEVVFESEDLNVFGVICEYFDEKNIGFHIWNCVSDLVKTLTGDAITPFNTIGEMINTIPKLLYCSEETAVLCIFDKTTKYYVLGWNYEEDIFLWNDILRRHFPTLKIVEE